MALDQLFDQFLGGGSPNTQGQSSVRPGGIADKFNRIPGGLMGGLAAGGVLGLLAGNKKIRKSARKIAGGAAGIGGGAALGVLAYSAYQKWQNGHGTVGETAEIPANDSAAANQVTDASEQAETHSGFGPHGDLGADGQPFKLSLVKAMVAAANADGHIDAKEHAALYDAAGKLQLDADDKALIFDTLRDPPSVKTIAGFAGGLEQASELYLVSRLAIDPDHPDERSYLRRLANQMHLPEDLVAQLEQQIEPSQTQAA